MSSSTHTFDANLLELKELLRSLLLRWKSGELDERAVHGEADTLWAEKEWPEYPDDDSRSVTLEVLSQLSSLNAQWIITDDIAAILLFLDTPPGQEKQGWERWQEYWDTLDWVKRRKSISNNPYYSRIGPHTED